MSPAIRQKHDCRRRFEVQATKALARAGRTPTQANRPSDATLITWPIAGQTVVKIATTNGASRARTDDLLHAMRPTGEDAEARNVNVYGRFAPLSRAAAAAVLCADYGRFAAITAALPIAIKGNDARVGAIELAVDHDLHTWARERLPCARRTRPPQVPAGVGDPHHVDPVWQHRGRVRRWPGVHREFCVRLR